MSNPPDARVGYPFPLLGGRDPFNHGSSFGSKPEPPYPIQYERDAAGFAPDTSRLLPPNHHLTVLCGRCRGHGQLRAQNGYQTTILCHACNGRGY